MTELGEQEMNWQKRCIMQRRRVMIMRCVGNRIIRAAIERKTLIRMYLGFLSNNFYNWHGNG